MKIIALTGLSLAAFNIQATPYNDALQTLGNAPAPVAKVMNEAPASYEYNSQFVRTSSVSYTGQTFRQILISDQKGAMSSIPRGTYTGTVSDAVDMLTSYYNYDENTGLSAVGVIDGFSEFNIRAKLLDGTRAEITEGFFFSDVQSPGKNLKDKVAGIDNPLRRGKLFGTATAQTPDELIKKYFAEYAELAVNGKAFTAPNGALVDQTINLANVTESGIDYAQLTQKFLHGAVSYSQAARDYLATDLGATKGLNADNTKPAKQGASYTALEHHFDEAFGYFGFARDFSKYTDTQTRSAGSIDTNNDGFISLKKEMNLGLSANTARVDLTSKDGLVDLSSEAINAFLKGRELIVKKPAGYLPYVVAQARVGLGAWEKTIAAVVIHYINKTTSEFNEYGTIEYLFQDFAKYWSEMKGYAFAFQFNPTGMMSDADFDRMHALMGEVPVLPNAPQAQLDAYKAGLIEAREILRKTYNFSEINVQNW
jgi:hypothetical protein